VNTRFEAQLVYEARILKNLFPYVSQDTMVRGAAISEKSGEGRDSVLH
jgi:hypothetical protein